MKSYLSQLHISFFNLTCRRYFEQINFLLFDLKFSSEQLLHFFYFSWASIFNFFDSLFMIHLNIVYLFQKLLFDLLFNVGFLFF